MSKRNTILAATLLGAGLLQVIAEDIQPVQTGGALLPCCNLAQRPGAAPFAKDYLGTWFPFHQIAFLNDGQYGNNSAWVAGTTDSFCGILFSSMERVTSIAFGRDNTGQLADRSAGTYTLQYTTNANPNAATPDEQWTTIGTLAKTESVRQRFKFPAVSATAIRLKVQVAAHGAGGAGAVDELEVYGMPKFEIETAAVRIKWFAEQDSWYVLQSTTDYLTWSNLALIRGNGFETNMVEWTTNRSTFYRLLQD